MKLYLSYPIFLYDSKLKSKFLRVIRESFGKVEIVDPSQFNFPHGRMELYYNVIDDCDVLVYVPILGFVTAGVYNEVKYALENNKRVYRIKDGKLIKVNDLRDIEEYVLNVEQTNKLYKALSVVDQYILMKELDKLSKFYSDKWDALRSFIDYHLDKYLPKHVNLKRAKRG